MTAWTKALPDWFDSLELKSGGHSTRADGMCVMEAAAYLAGRKHGDAPPCVCPVIGAFLRNWNDNLPDDETRTRLLKPLVPLVLQLRWPISPTNLSPCVRPWPNSTPNLTI